MFTPTPADIKTAHAAGARGIEFTYPQTEDDRLTFVRFDREYGHEWTYGYLVVSESAASTDYMACWVRRADCGLGCKCAAEFTIDHKAHGIEDKAVA